MVRAFTAMLARPSIEVTINTANHSSSLTKTARRGKTGQCGLRQYYSARLNSRKSKRLFQEFASEVVGPTTIAPHNPTTFMSSCRRMQTGRLSDDC
jgi:hypothetical protein